MLSIRKTDSGLEIVPGLRVPAVYLDYGLIADVVGTERGENLREQICAKGTLYLSWAHLLEYFALGSGRTFKRILNYLNGFGPHFAILDANAAMVVKRENEWTFGRQNPALDEDFLRLLAAHWDGQSELSIGILVEAMGSENGFFDGVKAIHSRHKENVKSLFDQQMQN